MLPAWSSLLSAAALAVSDERIKSLIGSPRVTGEQLAGLLWQGMRHPPDAADRECLARLGLDKPTHVAERAYRALVTAALQRSRRS
jgi:hypothetical protein